MFEGRFLALVDGAITGQDLVGDCPATVADEFPVVAVVLRAGEASFGAGAAAGTEAAIGAAGGGLRAAVTLAITLAAITLPLGAATAGALVADESGALVAEVVFLLARGEVALPLAVFAEAAARGDPSLGERGRGDLADDGEEGCSCTPTFSEEVSHGSFLLFASNCPPAAGVKCISFCPVVG